MVGFMGVGKTTVGRRVAQQLACLFVDLDQVIENEYGPIADIIQHQGEGLFRAIEYAALQRTLAGSPRAIVSTGGGIVTHAPSRALLQQCKPVIWLRAGMDTVLARIRSDRQHTRPLADERVGDRFQERAQWYQAVATDIIDCDTIIPKSVAEIIVNRYG